ncbi:hypothetical protein CALVIDRAFT_596842 [Calocera viscosa TUFC12733]|uniref:Integral membrane protein n=1 Tax=Calocera viscosa (strain TUFC12733) TaxID=1330018 RepID=A0A167P0Q6_CALVF|nr:hypothetical protein CALVIDRAFT_596842 [Calocera viscosa TUFC12733]
MATKVGVPIPANIPAPLAAYLRALAKRPLLTKMITGGVLSFLQEPLSSSLAHLPPPEPSPAVSRLSPELAILLARLHISPRALKLALYGFLVSAPMGHFLVLLITKAFSGVQGAKARIGQILMSNLVAAPIQVSAYLASMAIIHGARTPQQIVSSVQSGFLRAMKMTWITSPAAVLFAQQFFAPELWAPWFNFVNFCLGTYFGVVIKRAQIAKGKGKGKGKGKEEETEKKDL